MKTWTAEKLHALAATLIETPTVMPANRYLSDAFEVITAYAERIKSDDDAVTAETLAIAVRARNVYETDRQKNGLPPYEDGALRAALLAVWPNPPSHPEPAQHAVELSAWVGDMKTSAGMDYYVCVGTAYEYGKYLTPNHYKIRARAEYDVACWNHMLGRCAKPCLLDFDTDTTEEPAQVAVRADAFEREDRYFVIKKSHQSDDQLAALERLFDAWKICTVQCVVVESDWPEHEPVWAMLQARMTGQPTQAAQVPDGMALVPASFHIDKDAWEAAQFAFGGPGAGEGEEFMDCTAWIGDIENDDGSKTHGLHIQCNECPEEGSITIAEFGAAPTPAKETQ